MIQLALAQYLTILAKANCNTLHSSTPAINGGAIQASQLKQEAIHTSNHANHINQKNHGSDNCKIAEGVKY